MRPVQIASIVVLMLALGCLGLGGGQEQVSNASDANGTFQAPAVNKSAEANATNQTTEVCKPQWTLCPSGEQIKTRGCIDGHKITFTCKPYWKAHNLSTDGIPGQMVFLADYKCYWENREKFGYNTYYNPENICAGPIILGWKESCECGNYIDVMERAKLGR